MHQSVKLSALGWPRTFRCCQGWRPYTVTPIQETVHETLTLGRSTREAAYVAILQDDITEAEREAMTRHLRSEADAAWKKMHKVMYNHQLEYDRWLAAFLKEAETTLTNMRDQIWTTIHDLLRLPKSRAVHTPPAPADPHGHLVSDADTTHHRLLPGVFCLQKMALRTRWSLPPP